MNRIVVIFNSLMLVAAITVVLALIVGRVVADAGSTQVNPDQPLGSVAPTVSNPFFEPLPVEIAQPTTQPTPSPTPRLATSVAPTAAQFLAEATTVPNLVATRALPSMTAIVATTQFNEYTVQRGESLAAIAQRFGVSVRAIIAANTLVNPDAVPVGTVLRIPAN